MSTMENGMNSRIAISFTVERLGSCINYTRRYCENSKQIKMAGFNYLSEFAVEWIPIQAN